MLTLTHTRILIYMSVIAYITFSYTGPRNSAHTNAYPHTQVPIIAYIYILRHRWCSHSHIFSYNCAIIAFINILIYRCQR